MEVADGNQVDIKMTGNYNGKYIDKDGNIQFFVLKDMAYVMNLSWNLFSVTKEMEAGMKISNSEKYLIIGKNGRDMIFDQIIGTSDGFLCGMVVTPKLNK